jgi:hypothetical protein
MSTVRQLLAQLLALQFQLMDLSSVGALTK